MYSDNEPQPSDTVPSGLCHNTVGKINNEAELVSAYENGHIHFMEMSHEYQCTELVAALINQIPPW